MDYEKLTYINSRGETLEFSITSAYHCNVSKDVTGIAGIDNTIYKTNRLHRGAAVAKDVTSELVNYGDMEIIEL